MKKKRRHWRRFYFFKKVLRSAQEHLTGGGILVDYLYKGKFQAMRALAEESLNSSKIGIQRRLCNMLKETYSMERMAQGGTVFENFWRNALHLSRCLMARTLPRHELQEAAYRLHKEFERLLGDISPSSCERRMQICEAIFKATNRQLHLMHNDEVDAREPVGLLPPPVHMRAPGKRATHLKLVYSR